MCYGAWHGIILLREIKTTTYFVFRIYIIMNGIFYIVSHRYPFFLKATFYN